MRGSIRTFVRSIRTNSNTVVTCLQYLYILTLQACPINATMLFRGAKITPFIHYHDLCTIIRTTRDHVQNNHISDDDQPHFSVCISICTLCFLFWYIFF